MARSPNGAQPLALPAGEEEEGGGQENQKGKGNEKAGDEIIPTYPMVYEDEDGEMQEDTFDGDSIIVGEEGTIEFGFYSLEGSESSYLYCFQLTDIYGETQWSEFISFEL